MTNVTIHVGQGEDPYPRTTFHIDAQANVYQWDGETWNLIIKSQTGQELAQGFMSAPPGEGNGLRTRDSGFDVFARRDSDDVLRAAVLRMPGARPSDSGSVRTQVEHPTNPEIRGGVMRRRQRRILDAVHNPTKTDMENAVEQTIGAASGLMYRTAGRTPRDKFIEQTVPQLKKELMGIIEAYALQVSFATMQWRVTPPSDSGYYLAAYQKGRDWNVSELWYDPASIGSGWWTSRIYLGQESDSQGPVDVVAWMPIPSYKPGKH